MCCRARSLIGLEHEIRPPILLGQRGIGGHLSRIDIFVRTVTYVAVSARHAIHTALIGCSVEVAHFNERRMAVAGVPGGTERTLNQLNRFSGRVGSKSLHVVRLGAQRSIGPTQSLEQIVRSAILLHDQNHVLETWNLSVGKNGKGEREQTEEESEGELHGIS